MYVGSGGTGGQTTFNDAGNVYYDRGTGSCTATDVASASRAGNYFFLLYGNTHLVLNGSNDTVFLNGTTAQATIDDKGSGLYVNAVQAGNIVINGWQNDPTARIEITDLPAGGLPSGLRAFQLLVSDGHGGTMLTLPGLRSTIDFAGTSPGSIRASQFVDPDWLRG